MPAHKIRIAPAALKQLDDLAKPIKVRVQRKIDELASNPRPHGSKMLRGDRRWRVRVGDYRIIYEIRDNELVVIVVRVGHRREVYD